MWIKKMSRMILLGMIIIGSSLFPVSGFDTLRGQLAAIAQQASQEGAIEDLPNAVAKPGLYRKAYQHAKSELYTPTVHALDETFEIIGDRCGYEGVSMQHVSRVFGATPQGRAMKRTTRLHGGESVTITNDITFGDACLAVVNCYYRDELDQRDIKREDMQQYTTKINQSCKGVVASIYDAAYQLAVTEHTLSAKNYGEDLFINGVKSDAPYDLMIDIEDIGDHLFRQNVDVVPVQLYQGGNDQIRSQGAQRPGELVIDEPVDYESQERTDRYPPTYGVTPAVPDETSVTYPYPNIPPQGPELDPATLPEIMCLDDIPYQENDVLDEYENAVDDWVGVDTYLDDLDLTEEELSVLIAERLTQDQQEGLGDPDSTENPTGSSSPAGEEVAEFFDDLDGSTLEQIKAHVQGCIEQYTDYGTDSRRKTLWKSISQPTEFTQCVFAGLCKEVGDPTGLGIYNIKICKEPKKGGGVVSHQTVKSVEEIIDEMNTVCRSLQESGQLLKHNMTKDHREHKMMEINFGDVFSFGVHVMFDDPNDVRDYTLEKSQQIQNSLILEKRLLNMREKMTSLSQRNKYSIIDDTARRKGDEGYSDTVTQQRKVVIENQTAAADLRSAFELPRDAQKLGKIEMVEFMEMFVEENVAFWRGANDYTSSMGQTWRTAHEKKFGG